METLPDEMMQELETTEGERRMAYDKYLEDNRFKVEVLIEDVTYNIWHEAVIVGNLDVNIDGITENKFLLCYRTLLYRFAGRVKYVVEYGSDTDRPVCFSLVSSTDFFEYTSYYDQEKITLKKDHLKKYYLKGSTIRSANKLFYFENYFTKRKYTPLGTMAMDYYTQITTEGTPANKQFNSTGKETFREFMKEFQSTNETCIHFAKKYKKDVFDVYDQFETERLKNLKLVLLKYSTGGTKKHKRYRNKTKKSLKW